MCIARKRARGGHWEPLRVSCYAARPSGPLRGHLTALAGRDGPPPGHPSERSTVARLRRARSTYRTDPLPLALARGPGDPRPGRCGSTEGRGAPGCCASSAAAPADCQVHPSCSSCWTRGPCGGPPSSDLGGPFCCPSRGLDRPENRSLGSHALYVYREFLTSPEFRAFGALRGCW